MRKPYCCDASQHLFDQYYKHQQKGGGDFPVYVGRVRQRGHGIGDIFRTIWRYLFPAIKTMTPHALRTGANIVEDVSSGNTWKDSAMKHGPSLINQVPNVISSVVAEQKRQSGGSYRRRQSKRIKKRKRDIFS
jgi:hypothetical protein